MGVLEDADDEAALLPHPLCQQYAYSAAERTALVQGEMPRPNSDIFELLGHDGQLADGLLASVEKRTQAPLIEQLTTDKLCVMMESLWHLHLLCSNAPPGPGPSKRDTFLQQLGMDWFMAQQNSNNITQSNRRRGTDVMQYGLEKAEQTLLESCHGVGGPSS